MPLLLKRECPRGPREITKMWHMLEKLISLIFCREIPHGELIKVVYLFCSDLLLFSRKFAKIVRDAEPLKNSGHWSAEYQHKNFAPEKCKSKFAFLLSVYLCGRCWQII